MNWTPEPRIGEAVQVGYFPEASQFLIPISELFCRKMVGYSGVIDSLDNSIATGETIEDSCYAKGGFKYLYRGADNFLLEDFPTSELISSLNAIARSYVETRGWSVETTEVDVAWAVCQRDGDFGTIHNHQREGQDDTRFSAMLYLAAPPSINAGNFPSGCLHIIINDIVAYFPPIVNSVVAWPARALHGIHPFRGEGDRLGIAFDFTIRR